MGIVHGGNIQPIRYIQSIAMLMICCHIMIFILPSAPADGIPLRGAG